MRSMMNQKILSLRAFQMIFDSPKRPNNYAKNYNLEAAIDIQVSSGHKIT